MAKARRLIMHGEYSLRMCTDGQLHAFARQDNGKLSPVPMCGKRTTRTGAGKGSDAVHLKCMTKLEEFIGLRKGHLTDLAT